MLVCLCPSVWFCLPLCSPFCLSVFLCVCVVVFASLPLRVQDLWVLNPGSASSARLCAYRMLGRVVGVAIRGFLSLPLQLHENFWAAALGTQQKVRDIQHTDVLSMQLINKVRHTHRQRQKTGKSYRLTGIDRLI